MPTQFLPAAIQQFEYYKLIGERAMAQLPDEALLFQPTPESNSIAVIVKHLWGNMLSRWTDFLTTDGEKEWRQRDAEFESEHASRDEILARWNEGWACLFTALNGLSEADLGAVVYIRNEGHTVLEAISRQLAHYPYHIGQIVFIGKMVQDADWTSLSIPKRASDAYNAGKFAQPQSIRHFTEEWKETASTSKE